MLRMGRLAIWAVALILSISSVMVTTASAQGVERFIVASGADVEAAVRGAGGTVIHRLERSGLLVVSVPASRAAQVERDPRLRLVERDQRFTVAPAATVSIADGSALWGRTAVGADRTTLTGAGVKVAVLDTGIALNHPNLRVAGGVNVIDPGGSYNDVRGHGTHVAGIIGAQGRDGVTGVAPGASLYAVKILGDDGSGWISDIIAGIEWAVQNRMQVINMSIGSHVTSRALEQATSAAQAAGVVLVASAGNSGNHAGRGNLLEAPGRYPAVISVGAVNPNLTRAFFSSTGRELDLVAPGVDIVSTYPGGGYQVMSGTSMAAPFVAGAAALALQKTQGAGPEQVAAQLTGSARPLAPGGWDWQYGYGLVQVPQR